MTEDYLFFAVMHAGIEPELLIFAQIEDGPTRERARYSNDVVLRVASVNTHRVEFHQLAPVVFIESRLPSRSPGCRRRNREIIARGLRLPVVQVKEHRRMARCRQEHVLEAPENMRANSIPLKAGEQDAILAFAAKDI